VLVGDRDCGDIPRNADSRLDRKPKTHGEEAVKIVDWEAREKAVISAFRSAEGDLSAKQLIAQTHFTRGAVIRILKSLDEQGYILKTTRSNNQYGYTRTYMLFESGLGNKLEPREKE
jgi:DNA-binding MarR family transcriptional regulator